MTEIILESVKGTLAIESLQMSIQAEQLNRLLLAGQITGSEAIKRIKEVYIQ